MWNSVRHDALLPKASRVLTSLLGAGGDLEVLSDERTGPDLVINASGKTFFVLLRVSTGAGPIAAAARQLLSCKAQTKKQVVPLLAVPYMGKVGQDICRELGLGWFDLGGNAHIVAPNLRIIVEGRPNLFLAAGRPPNLFAPKSSRVARWLLIHPDEPVTQRELARAVEMGEGFVSRVVSRLIQEGHLFRENGKALRIKDPSLLLDAWSERYDFSRHTIQKGHIAARSGDALLERLRDMLRSKNIEYAVTGLAAAWVHIRFAGFRTVALYLSQAPSDELQKDLGFSNDPRGANTWLVVPNDRGVFHGASAKKGIRCVHPVQAYLDLKGQPERAAEAAEELRKEHMNWKRHG